VHSNGFAKLAQRGSDKIPTCQEVVGKPQAVHPLSQVVHLAAPEPSARTGL
jgi:hypothetical protein